MIYLLVADMLAPEDEISTSLRVRKNAKFAALIFFAAAVLLFIAHLLKGIELSGKADFYWVYIAGTEVRTGHALDLYNLALYPFSAPFDRAAWESLLFVPFTFFPFSVALRLWNTVSIVLFGVSGWLLRYEIRDILVSRPQFLRRLFLFALLIPIGETLAFGQDAALFLLFIVLALKSAKNRKDWDAGIWIGLASIKLQLLLPLFLLIILRRKWQIAWSVALTGIFLFCISTALAGPNWVFACIHTQASVTDQMGYLTARYILTLSGVHKLTLVILVAGVLVSLWLVRNMPFERAAAWMIVSAIFFNWHSLPYDYASALPAIVLKESPLKGGEDTITTGRHLIHSAARNVCGTSQH